MTSEQPRYKDYLLAAWCTVFDGLTGAQQLYRADKRGPGVWLGEQLQVLWFWAHNCRLYQWLANESAPEVPQRGFVVSEPTVTWTSTIPMTVTTTSTTTRATP